MTSLPTPALATPLRPTARIIPFPSAARRADRLTLQDRAEALRWLDGTGYGRLAFDISFADDGHELGDFLLIYQRDASWSCWGVGCTDGGYMVWRPANSATLGWYPTLRQALAAIPAPEPSTRKRALTALHGTARIA